MLTSGEVFGSYRVLREVGRGAMGAVFEVEHLHLRKRFAVKMLLPHALTDRVTLQRFLREGEVASRIRHENIIDVSDVGVFEDAPYLVMEYLHGETLADRLLRGGALGVTELVDLMVPVCDALAAAHDAGVVHRDIKPENIFLARARRGLRPKVLDFGICKVEHVQDANLARLTSSTIVIGTPCYLSPEAARSAQTIGPRSDQYAFGVTLFECCTARLPFERTTLYEMITALLFEDPPRPTELVPDLDPRLEEVILRAMSRDPKERFADMRELALALLPMASETVRAHWEADLRDPHHGPKFTSLPPRAPIGNFDLTAEAARETFDLDNLDELGDSLALTGEGSLVIDLVRPLAVRPAEPAAAPREAARSPASDAPVAKPARRPVAARPWFVGATLTVGVALMGSVLALGARHDPAVGVLRPAPAARPQAPTTAALAPVRPETVPSLAAPPARVEAAAPSARARRAPVQRLARGRNAIASAAPVPSAAPVAPSSAVPTSAVEPSQTDLHRSLLRTDFGSR